MISESQYIYYLGYAALCVLLGISYFKVKSTEGLTITTKEFKLFQTISQSSSWSTFTQSASSAFEM